MFPLLCCYGRAMIFFARQHSTRRKAHRKAYLTQAYSKFRSTFQRRKKTHPIPRIHCFQNSFGGLLSSTHARLSTHGTTVVNNKYNIFRFWCGCFNIKRSESRIVSPAVCLVFKRWVVSIHALLGSKVLPLNHRIISQILPHYFLYVIRHMDGVGRGILRYFYTNTRKIHF